MTTLLVSQTAEVAAFNWAANALASTACPSKPSPSALARFLYSLRSGLERRAAVRTLSALDDLALADIGIRRESLQAGVICRQAQ